jgi:hypothetical protein
MVLEHDGRKQSPAAWAREAGMSLPAFRARLRYGWSLADALSVPLRPNKRRQTEPTPTKLLALVIDDETMRQALRSHLEQQLGGATVIVRVLADQAGWRIELASTERPIR